jgi:multidrug efflux pump subunit AcrA (membrane-fusion protein)
MVDNADRRLKPGFFAKGMILTRKDENVIAVPDSAVSTFAGVSSVYVVKDDKITQQNVTLGVRQGNLWEVIDGIKGTEVLANNRLNELATGTRVELDTSTPDAGGGRKGGGKGKGGGRGGKKSGSGGQP